MRNEWFQRLMNSYDRIVREHEFFNSFFAAHGPGAAS
jgi:hypothetical protein